MAVTHEGALKIAARKAGLDVGEYLARKSAGLKRCTACKDWQSTSLFNVDRTRYDGLSAKGRCCTRVAVRVSTKGRQSAFKGKTHSDETRAAMSADRLGKPSPRRGTTLPLEVRAKISQVVRKNAVRGADAHGYIDGKGLERRGIRNSEAAKRWRYDVMLRDRFTCQHCGDARGGNLHAHHLKPFATHPELRFELSNGLTLCIPCHKAVHAKRA